MNKILRTFFAIMASAMLLGACYPQASDGMTEDDKKTQEAQIVDEAMLSLANAVPARPKEASDLQLKFNLELLKKLGELEDGNLFYSPMSINAAMTMAYFGANGETQQEIADTLGYNSMDMTQVAAYQKYLMQSYKDSGDTVFTEANSIWIDDLFGPKQSYIDTMNDVFQTEVTRLDLQKSDAVDTLNKWIKKSTNGMIEELFDNEDNPFIDGPPTAMVLLNAIYFNGKWTSPFNPEKTFDSKFNGMSETSDVKMMTSDETVKGDQGEDYISVSLPYGDDERFSMVAVLPDDMTSFLERLTQESLSGILNTFYEKHEPIVQLPVFEMEQKFRLNDALYALGIEKAFSQNDADFTGMCEENILFIDEVLQKAKIKVDEEGTEAAAATSVEMALKGAMPGDRFEFIADRPFLFFIVDTENDLVLFTGKVCDLR